VETSEAQTEDDIREVGEEDMDEEEEEDTLVVDKNCLSSLTVVKWAMYFDYVPNHVHYMGTSITLRSMSQKTT
jgi:hypothetical protein